jgi:hypothetical protein
MNDQTTYAIRASGAVGYGCLSVHREWPWAVVRVQDELRGSQRDAVRLVRACVRAAPFLWGCETDAERASCSVVPLHGAAAEPAHGLLLMRVHHAHVDVLRLLGSRDGALLLSSIRAAAAKSTSAPSIPTVASKQTRNAGPKHTHTRTGRGGGGTGSRGGREGQQGACGSASADAVDQTHCVPPHSTTRPTHAKRLAPSRASPWSARSPSGGSAPQCPSGSARASCARGACTPPPPASHTHTFAHTPSPLSPSRVTSAGGGYCCCGRSGSWALGRSVLASAPIPVFFWFPSTRKRRRFLA